LWRVGGKGTTKEFLEDGPFTRIKENGRPADTGNFVVKSYFKAVVKNFCSRHHLVYKEFLESLWTGDEIKASVDQGSFESATAAGWSAATPLWASIKKQPPLVKSNSNYLRGIFWKKEHHSLLPASWSLEQATVIAKVLESTVKKPGEVNSKGGDFGTEDKGDDNSLDNWVGRYVPAEAAEFAEWVSAEAALSGLDGAGGGHDSGSGGATVPVEISRAVVQSVQELFPRKRLASEAGLDTGEPLGNACLRDDKKVRPEDQKAAKDYYGDVVALQCDWCEKWRFVEPSVHRDRFTERAQAEDSVLFQCFQLNWKDGRGCGVTCETPSQKFCPPNPNDPGERPLALEARNGFLTWARKHLHAEDFVVPGSTVEEEDARGEFHREHYWRYLWFSQEIVPAGTQGTFGAFDGRVDAFGAVQGSFHAFGE
jgi:hypothetical protein